ncbi:hypothetical protein OG474_30055 [Kribbella sp. NBC_01505]|uniref:hypothetical protein n=1 Tax=Kribbella sp. NBC_01505 TaxID=2903580 RepID=UPI00386BEA29
MSETTVETQPAPDMPTADGAPTPTTPPPAEDAQGNGSTSTGAQPDPMAELPEWAKKEIAKLRSENANSRVKAREAETKLSAAKTPEEFEAAVAEVKATNAELERRVLVSEAARKHKLPDELAEVLKGSTVEELEAHAKTLAKFAPAEQSEPEKLSGGLNPTDQDAAFDPVAASRAARKRRR